MTNLKVNVDSISKTNHMPQNKHYYKFIEKIKQEKSTTAPQRRRRDG